MCSYLIELYHLQVQRAFERASVDDLTEDGVSAVITSVSELLLLGILCNYVDFDAGNYIQFTNSNRVSYCLYI